MLRRTANARENGTARERLFRNATADYVVYYVKSCTVSSSNIVGEDRQNSKW